MKLFLSICIFLSATLANANEYTGGLLPLPGRNRAATTYWISTARTDFNTALNYCQGSGRKLLTLKNDLIAKDVYQRILDAGIYTVPVWLCTYVGSTNRWMWCDGTPIGIFNDFAPGYSANTLQSQSALMINSYFTTDPANSFKWQPDYTFNENFFICQS